MFSNAKDNYLLNKCKMMEEVQITDLSNMIYKGNRKCQVNSLSYALKHKDKVRNIVAGIQVFSDGPIAHFVIELNNGLYVDPTYGNVSTQMYEHFIPIKTYDDFDSFVPNEELMNMKQYIYDMLPLRFKLFTDMNRC